MCVTYSVQITFQTLTSIENERGSMDVLYDCAVFTLYRQCPTAMPVGTMCTARHWLACKRVCAHKRRA